MKPSRTYTLGIAVMIGELTLAALALGASATIDNPAIVSDLLALFANLGMYLAGGGTVSAGGMAARDYGSGGLTSSQGDQILAARPDPMP